MLLNKERAEAAMNIASVDAIVATTPDNVMYMSDFFGWRLWVYRGNTPARGLQCCVVLPQKKEPVIIIPKVEHPSFVQESVWV